MFECKVGNLLKIDIFSFFDERGVGGEYQIKFSKKSEKFGKMTKKGVLR